MNYLFENYNGIEVAWLPELDGGGRETRREFVIILKKMIGKVDRLCEFCAGPAFIGFTLLSEGLCNSLCLIDVNPKAVNAIKETIKKNQLQEKVTVYLSDGLKHIPEKEKWDIVVSNPPHFRANSEEEYKEDIIRRDNGWSIHENFFLNIRKFLKPHGTLIFQECYIGSEEKDFLPFLEKGNLKLIDSFMFKKKDDQWRDVYYYIVAKLKHDDFLSEDKKVKIIKISVSNLYKNPPTKLESWEKYRFEIKNDLNQQKSIAILNGKDKKGKDIRVFSVEKIPANSKKQSNIFYLTPGIYDLVELDTKKQLSKIEVK